VAFVIVLPCYPNIFYVIKIMCLVVMMLNIYREPSGNGDIFAQGLRDKNTEIAFVLTKADKCSGSQGKIARRRVGEHLRVPHGELLPFSAKARSGKGDIWRVIETVYRPKP